MLAEASVRRWEKMNDEVTKRNRTTGQGCAISVWGIYKGNLVVIPTRPVAAMSGIVTFVD
jgi:hypothetical protein